MADTPTAEQRAHLYEHGSLECLIPKCSCCPALISVILEAEAAAEARGFARGLEEAARVCDAGLTQWAGNVYSPGWAGAAGTLAARIRALAPKAPPEVAAAEPKP